MPIMWESTITEEEKDESDVYDLPFGKASQTAKRYEEKKLKQDSPDSIGSTCRQKDIGNLSSQDLFGPQDLNSGTSLAERVNIFSPIIRSQLGMKFGKTAAREIFHKEFDYKPKKSLVNKNKIFSPNFVSLENSDLPHPRHLFRKKRTRRIQKSSAQTYKSELHDKAGMAVYGHIQQLKSKLAHRTPQIRLSNEGADVQTIETPDTPDDRNIYLPCIPVDRKVQFPNVLDERKEHKSFSLYEVSNETIKACDEVDVSLYQRWMTDVSFVEEE